MKECMLRSTKFGACFFCWRTRWKVCISGFVAATFIWTTGLRLPREQHAAVRVEQAMKAEQEPGFAITLGAACAYITCALGLIDIENRGRIGFLPAMPAMPAKAGIQLGGRSSLFAKSGTGFPPSR